MSPRTHVDRCPGVLRPWIADDGAIVRLRLVGGRLPARSLRRMVDVARQHGDGTLLLTKRTNLQVRGIEHRDGCVPDAVVRAVTEAGLLPVPSHELVRNIMVSPLSGRLGGRADLRAVAEGLDVLLCADPVFAGLAGRFLFVLDDGRGDVADRPLDVGLMAVDAEHGQVRIGSHHWGPVVPLPEAPATMLDVVRHFLAVRGDGEAAVWHVDELPGHGEKLTSTHWARDLRTQVSSLPVPFGRMRQDDGRDVEHVEVPDGVLTPDLALDLLGRAGDELVVTPWRSVLLPDLDPEDA